MMVAKRYVAKQPLGRVTLVTTSDFIAEPVEKPRDRCSLAGALQKAAEQSLTFATFDPTDQCFRGRVTATLCSREPDP